MLFIPICLTACKNNNTTNSPPFSYTASTLMYDGCEILDFYSTDYSIISNEDNSTIQASDCLYNTGNEDCYSLISKCYEFLTYCANGGYSYTDNIGYGITNAYNFKFSETQCIVKHTYQNNNSDPTSSAFRIIRNYDIAFTADHVSIVYERESYYDDIKHYIDILSTNEGIFIQYYIKTYNDYSKVYTYQIYKFFYNEHLENFYYTSNQIKRGTSTITLPDIEITTFDNFILPDFLYTLNINCS